LKQKPNQARRAKLSASAKSANPKSGETTTTSPAGEYPRGFTLHALLSAPAAEATVQKWEAREHEALRGRGNRERQIDLHVAGRVSAE
jgi:hypothetical protein